MIFSPSVHYAAGFSFLLAPINSMAGTDVGLSLGEEWAYGTRLEETQKLETTIKPELHTSLGADSQLTLIGRLRNDMQDNIDASHNSDVELRELYLECAIGRSLITLGRQQIVWGKADGLKVLDVVNPQAWREFILDDFDESRIPLWSVNAEIPIRNITLQLLWLPDQTYHELADNGDSFPITAPSRVPTSPPGVTVVQEQKIKPDATLGDADWGMRLSSFWHGWDLTLNYLYHYHDMPVLYRRLSMSGSVPLVTITPRYRRSHLLGGSFSTAFGDFTLRGELGYWIDRYFSTNDISDSDGVVASDESAYVLGLDWFGLSDTLISGQLFQSRLTHHPSGVIREQIESIVTLLFRREFLNETFRAELLVLHSLDLDDGLARPKVIYQLNDDISLWLGADIFYGDHEGLFGEFDRQDRVVTGIELSI